MEEKNLDQIKNGEEKVKGIDEILEKDSSGDKLTNVERQKLENFIQSLYDKDPVDLSEMEAYWKEYYSRKQDKKEKIKKRKEEAIKSAETAIPSSKIRTTENDKVIELNSIKIKKNVDKSNVLERVKKKVLSTASTTMVTLPYSGYSAHMMGLTTDELNNYMQIEGTKGERLQAKYEMVFSKIKESTIIGRFTYDDFLQITLADELDILMFGILMQTFEDKIDFPFECLGVPNIVDDEHPDVIKAKEEGKAHGEFMLTINAEDLLLFPDPETKEFGVTMAKIREVVSKERTIDEVKEISESTKAKRLLLEKSGNVIDLSRPTLLDRYESIDAVTEKFYKKHTVSCELAQYVSALYIPDNDDDGYIPLTDYLDIVEGMSLTQRDRDNKVLSKAVENIAKDLQIAFGFEDVRCPTCDIQIHDRVNLSIEQLVFTLHGLEMRD